MPSEEARMKAEATQGLRLSRVRSENWRNFSNVDVELQRQCSWSARMPGEIEPARRFPPSS